MYRRDEAITQMIQFAWQTLGVNLLPAGETEFVLTMWALLDDAIESEVRAQSAYRRLQHVSLN